MMWKVLGSILCDLDPNIQGQGHLMHCLVNAFPKQLGVATLNFAGAYVCDMLKRVLGNISCYLDTKVKVKKRVPSTAALFIILFAYLFILVGVFYIRYEHLVHNIICKTDQLLLQKFDDILNRSMKGVCAMRGSNENTTKLTILIPSPMWIPISNHLAKSFAGRPN